MNGATTCGGTRIGRPVARSRIAQTVRARTQVFPSLTLSSTKRSKRAPPGSVADPGAGGDPVAFASRAQIVDLVPDHDPEIGVVMLPGGDRAPVRDRDLLNPLHPDGIVDVPELVDVFGKSRKLQLEDRPGHRIPP
jgi:hypothetical protein